MKTTTEMLTPEELAEIEKRRAAAKERARRLQPLSEEEDAAIVAAAMSDPDAPPMTDEQLARLRPAHEVLPGLVAEVLRRPRGRPKIERPKEQITIRLDRDVVEHYRESGPGWQTRMNDVLRKAAKVRR